MYQIKNIVFFCPSRITGGHEYLSVRLADYLLSNYREYNIYYIDYPDGFSHTRWHSDSINYIDYESKDKPVDIPPHSVVIAQLNIISQLDRFTIQYENSFVLFWFIHTLNIRSQISYKNIYFLSHKERKILGEEINILSKYGIIKCPSIVAYADLVRDLYQLPEEYVWLPIIAPISINCPKPSFERLSKNIIKFCWLGRLDDEKARNVLTYMNELEELSNRHNLSLSLIGRGPAEEKLKKISKKYSYPITFVGEKRDKDLDEFIRKETEIGLASGTSAFEFSLRGKPVIMEWVIDKVFKAGVRNTYVFTDEDEIIDMASIKQIKRIKSSSFSEKLNEALSNYSSVSKRGYDFVLNKSAKACAANLIYTILEISLYPSEDIMNHINICSDIINRARKRMLPLIKTKSLFRI